MRPHPVPRPHARPQRVLPPVEFVIADRRRGEAERVEQVGHRPAEREVRRGRALELVARVEPDDQRRDAHAEDVRHGGRREEVGLSWFLATLLDRRLCDLLLRCSACRAHDGDNIQQSKEGKKNERPERKEKDEDVGSASLTLGQHYARDARQCRLARCDPRPPPA